MQANQRYWNDERKPDLDHVMFRNDLTKDQAIELCMNTVGEVDLVTGVPPIKVHDVQQSVHAKLVRDKGNQLITGVFNRYKTINHDQNFRLALNHAVNKKDLIQKGLLGYGKEVPALTPPWALDFPEGLEPYEYNPTLAKNYLRQSSWDMESVFYIAVFEDLADIGYLLMEQLRDILGINVNVDIIPSDQQLKWRHILAEKKLNPHYDLFLINIGTLFLEGTPAFYHREVFGVDGAYRVGPEIPEFNELYQLFAQETDTDKFLKRAKALDRYVYDEALGLFLFSPDQLYAVNRYVNFVPYRTSLEFANTSVDPRHWSRS